MSRIKAIIIFAIAIIFVAMGVSIQVLSKNLKQKKADNERLWANNMELYAQNRQNTALIYTKDEFNRIISDSLKNALNSLKIKPKEVTKVIYKYITDIDTIDRLVYVDYRKTHWMVSDTGKCFTWSARAFLSDTTLNIIRTDFTYTNNISDYYYQRRPHKILFISFGKRVIKHVTVPECGTAREEVIEIKR